MILPILLAFFFVFVPQDEAVHKLPAWTNAPAEPNLFVIETEKFFDHGEAVDNLLPAVKSAVIEWAERNVGSDCRPFLESMPQDDYRQFIHENQEIVHTTRETYDAERAKRMEKPFDEYHRGYVRVEIDEAFFTGIQDLRTVRLKNRMCATLLSALFVLGSLGILWCSFYMRRKSRGLYIKRIRWIVGGLIALLMVVCYSAYRLLF